MERGVLNKGSDIFVWMFRVDWKERKKHIMKAWFGPTLPFCRKINPSDLL